MVKSKIAFFSKGDNKFIQDIFEYLKEIYETRLITVLAAEDFKLIDQWMKWADICWFEWCDDLIIYGSNLKIAWSKIIICRLHSYEAFTYYPSKVNWNVVDKLIFVSKDIQKYVTKTFKISTDITEIIPNGVELNNFSFRERKPGFKIAYVGYLNYKKGPMLLLQIFKEIYETDSRYELYIAGSFQDPRYTLYFNQMINELGLVNNYFFEGWQSDINKWLEDKDYIICSSVLESQNVSIMQAMAKGIKPVIHNFTGAKDIYPQKYIWNTISEAVTMVKEDSYTPEEYRTYIQEHFEIGEQCRKIKKVLDQLINSGYKAAEIRNQEFCNYVRCRMEEFISYNPDDYDKFDFEHSDIMLGKIDRTVAGSELLEFILKDRQNNMLVVNNIWNNRVGKGLILPEQMQKSINAGKIEGLCNEILTYDIKFQYCMGGFVLDSLIEEDIRKNYKAYLWERGIPASEFLPVMTYMKIIERYIFASEYIYKDSCVLEAPCGFGYGAAYLSKKCRQVEALDIAKDNIEFSKRAYRNSNINWTIGDVMALPYDNDKFDAYVSFEVFEHLPVDAAIKHIEEAYRVIKKNGCFLISTPNREMRKNVNNPFHTKEYDFGEFSTILNKVFDSVELFSMVGLNIEKGINEKAYVMLAVCKKEKM